MFFSRYLREITQLSSSFHRSSETGCVVFFEWGTNHDPLAPTPRARDQGAFLGVVLGPELGEPDVTVPRGVCADPLVIHITGEVLAAHGRALAGSAHPLMTCCGKEDGGI